MPHSHPTRIFQEYGPLVWLPLQPLDRQCWNAAHCKRMEQSGNIRTCSRRGSRINTDRLSERATKAQGCKGVRGHAPPGNFLGFWVFWRDIGKFHFPRIKLWKSADYFISRFQLGKFFYILKIYLLWKLWLISVKRRKPEWIRASVQGKALRTAMYKSYINSIKATLPPADPFENTEAIRLSNS